MEQVTPEIDAMWELLYEWAMKGASQKTQPAPGNELEKIVLRLISTAVVHHTTKIEDMVMVLEKFRADNKDRLGPELNALFNEVSAISVRTD